jgi:2-dehydro-3-deoxy-D-gluconate 5-dehydrogenase
MSVIERFRLDGRTALVTGCRRGIGRALARALAEAGADIVGVSAHLESTGSAIEGEVRAVGRAFHPYTCDLGDRRALHRFVEQVHADGHQIDILLNNAGIIPRRPAAEHPDEIWDQVIEVDLNAPFVLAREFGRRMLERGWGRIVFTASVLSFQGGITVPSYAAAKGGLVQLARALANEWAGGGVNVNAIAPGYIETEITQALRDDPVRSSQITARIPAGRWGRPEDLEGAVVFLCSEAAAYVHGATVLVDGGWMGR